jgi:hypothetical protein
LTGSLLPPIEQFIRLEDNVSVNANAATVVSSFIFLNRDLSLFIIVGESFVSFDLYADIYTPFKSF